MSRTLMTCLLLALPAFTGSAGAQDDPEAATEPAALEAVQEETAAAEDQDPGRAPDDYEASEQISEDNSVSFPVDI